MIFGGLAGWISWKVKIVQLLTQIHDLIRSNIPRSFGATVR